MNYIIIIFAIISFLYTVIIICFTIGWIRIKPFIFKKDIPTISVSIVIPFRNEEENILNIIHDIKNQTFKNNCIELILVNDHSTDKSVEIIKKQKLGEIKSKLLNLEQNQGKKAALKLGIENSNHEIITTTDADCRVGKNWLNTIINYYMQNKPKVIVGPVLFKVRKGFLNYFQNLDFLSLIASTAGAIGIFKPIMANGANLTFEKKIFNEINLKKLIASGDDVFLIHETKKRNRNGIIFLKSNEALVITESPKNVKQLLQQRIRWFSKSKYYNDFDAIFTACTVLLFNVLIIFLLIIGIVNPIYLILSFIGFSVKLIIDFPLLLISSKFFGRIYLLKFYPVVQLIYPFYIVGIVILGIFCRSTWKGRAIK